MRIRCPTEYIIVYKTQRPGLVCMQQSGGAASRLLHVCFAFCGPNIPPRFAFCLLIPLIASDYCHFKGRPRHH